MTTKVRATIDDLYLIPDNGKAELVDGEITLMSPTGDAPSSAAFNIAVSLKGMTGEVPGRAYTDNVAYRVRLQNRGSFSPEASWYTGPRTGMKFLEGAPAFAVEVRSEGDYGPVAEKAMARKCRDYFAAGTLVVWDVDLLSPDVIKSYDFRSPDTPRIFRKGDIADAEPAVPGWRFPVDDLFL